MRALAIVPTHNTKKKKDVTGAFLPEAQRFLKLHGVPRKTGLVRFDNRVRWKVKRRDEVERAIDEHGFDGPLEHVALFCHGLRDKVQTGHTTRSVEGLAEVIASRSVEDVRVTLYCCDTARDADRQKKDDRLPGPGGDGGFADRLRDALSAFGCAGGWVDGHTVTAHTTRAPFVRRFYTDGDPDGGEGGDWLVGPRSELWSTWRKALWSKTRPKDVRFRFPRWTILELHAALARD